eukprot:Clim_evm89s144 gene=Clim_evmTU89s144
MMPQDSRAERARADWEENTSQWVVLRQRWTFWIQRHKWAHANWFGSWSSTLIEINTLEFITVIFIAGLFLLVGWIMGSHFGDATPLFWGMALLLIARHNVITAVTGISWERLVKYHRWFAYLALIPVITHGYHYTWEDNFCTGDPNCVPVVYLWADGIWYGALAAMLFFALIILALPIIRRRFHGFFYVTHFIWIAVIVVAILHTNHVLFFTALPLVLYAVDKIIRWSNTTTARVTDVQHFDGDVVKITIEKPFSYLPGQFAYFHTGPFKRGPYSWHPLSLSSTPLDPDHATVTVKAVGGWTRDLSKQMYEGQQQRLLGSIEKEKGDKGELYDESNPGQVHNVPAEEPHTVAKEDKDVEAQGSAGSDSTKGAPFANPAYDGPLKGQRIHVSGPYGMPSIPSLQRYDGLLLIGGGIGVTPMMSQYLTMNPARQSEVEHLTYTAMHRHGVCRLPAEVSEVRHRRQMKGTRLLWTVAKETYIDWFADELATMGRALAPNNSDHKASWDASCRVFVSRQKTLSPEYAKASLEVEGYETNIGRPNLREEFEAFRRELEDAQTYRQRPSQLSCGQEDGGADLERPKKLYIAVFVCGPAILMADVAKMVRCMSDENAEYHLHAETFTM